jgi:hypothetical protein
MFVSGAAGIYGPNSFSLARLHFYVFFFSNVSQMWALYCLVMFYVALKEELAPFNPVLKFVIVKAVVFFCFWQVCVRFTVFSYYRMCSLTAECVLLTHRAPCWASWRTWGISKVTTECVLLLQNVFSYTQGTLLGFMAYMGYIKGTNDFDSAQIVEAIQVLLQNVFSYYRMCSLTIPCVLLR